MVESTLIVWEDLGLSPMYANCVCFCYYCFNDMLGHISYEIMLELCVLARNISWPGGLALI